MQNKLTYIFCTIAIGESYLDSAIKFATDLNKVSTTHKVLIVTDIDAAEIQNTFFVKISDNETFMINNYFNYNLKYIPILESLKLNFDFILYFDSDWRIYKDYKESYVLNFLDMFNASNLDFIFERPHYIGGGKTDLNTCFWRHKIEPYKLMETDKYDLGHVCNEQFMAFKRNSKLNIFCEKWKERNEFGVANNIWAFAEGLEIGMSSIDANMNFSWSALHYLKSCFIFTSNSGHEYIRY